MKLVVTVSSFSKNKKLPNLICTPHIDGNAKEAVEAMGMSAIEHLKRFYNL